MGNLGVDVMDHQPKTDFVSENNTKQESTGSRSLEDLGKINFLEDWLVAHKTQVGPSYDALLSDVQDQRIRLYETTDLKGFYDKYTHELALAMAAINRIPRWEQVVEIKPVSFQRVRAILDKRIKHLFIWLRIQTNPKIALSEIEILDYVITAIPGWVDGSTFSLQDAQLLRSYLEGKRDTELTDLAKQLALLQSVLDLLPVWMKADQIPERLGRGLEKHLVAQKLRSIVFLEGRCPEVDSVSKLQVINFAIAELPNWVQSLNLSCDDPAVIKLQNFLMTQRQALIQPSPAPAIIKPAMQTAPAAPAITVPPKPKPESRPPAPPVTAKPPRPPIDWGNIWDKIVQAAVSGALLRGLLYLGAFMIVVSLSILVVRFWDLFPSIVQAVFIFSVPSVFYLAGWLIRSKLKLPQAGNALSGIGALLVAVDFAAIYQFGDLAVDFNLYWSIASLLCTLIYALTAWRLNGIFFDFIALIGGTNILVALTRLSGLGLEWNIVALSVASTLMTAAAPRLWSAGDPLRDTAAATRYLPQVLLPLSLAAVIFVPDVSGAAQTIAFLFATFSYAILAWSFPAQVFAHACIVCSLGVLGLGLNAFALPPVWCGAASAVFAVPYSLVSRWMDNRLPPDFPGRTQYLFAPEIAGFLLALLGLILGIITLFFDLWAGIIALTLLSLSLTVWAILYSQSFFIVLAGGLFCVPFSLGTMRILQNAAVDPWFDWLPAAWCALGFCYLGAAVLLRKARSYASALYLWALTLSILAGLVLLRYVSAKVTWQYIPSLVGLGGILVIYLVSALIHDRGTHPGLSVAITNKIPGSLGQSIFVWLLALLIPVWVSLVWMGSLVPNVSGSMSWLGPMLVGIGIVYIPLGQLLTRRNDTYSLPLHVTTVLLGITGALLAANNLPAVTAALYLDVVILVLFAFVYRRVTSIALISIASASLLLVLPFQLTLSLLNILDHAQSLGYALLVCFLYMPVGLLLDRVGAQLPAFTRRYSLPVFIVGYLLSLYAISASLLGRLGVYAVDLPWIGVLTPLVISSLYLFSLYYFRISVWAAIFAWANVLTLILVYGQFLVLVRLPMEFIASAWAVLPITFLLVGRILFHSRIEWLRRVHLPLAVSVPSLGIAALALTAPATLNAFLYEPAAAQKPALILAQLLVFLLPILSAVLYKIAWPLFIEPWLAFLPVTMFFIGYSEMIFKTPLTLQGFGLVWICLGITHLLMAAVVDSRKVRYAHGLYLGGYALAIFSVFWTLSPRYVLVWTLGLWILICIASAFFIHAKRHRTWNEIISAIFAQRSGILHDLVENTFLWLTAWLIPIWCVILLSQFASTAQFQWLGFSAAALVYLGLGLGLGKIKKSYAWSFNWAAQFFTVLALMTGIRLTLDILMGTVSMAEQLQSIISLIAVQICAVIFYIFSAAIQRRSIFAHLASWLAFFPYTLSWITFGTLDGAELALPWMVLATILLLAGFVLDRTPIRYAHGPYLVGLLLAAFALFWSIPDRLTNVIILGWCILLALIAQILVHTRRLITWTDLTRTTLHRQPDTSIPVRVARQFLFVFLCRHISNLACFVVEPL